MKRLALLLAVLTLLTLGANPNKSGGGAGFNHEFTQDVDANTFSINSTLVDVNDDGSTVTGHINPFLERTIIAGPYYVCETASDSTVDLIQNGCNDDADCATSDCVHDETLDTINTRFGSMVAGSSLNNSPPPVSGGTAWLGIDQVFRGPCYNTTGACVGTTASNDNYATWLFQYEGDFRPDNLRRKMEMFVETYPAQASTYFAGSPTFRPWFYSFNHHPNHILGDQSTINETEVSLNGALWKSEANDGHESLFMAAFGGDDRWLPGLYIGPADTRVSSAALQIQSNWQAGTENPAQASTDMTSDWASSTAGFTRGAIINHVSGIEETGDGAGITARASSGLNNWGACDGNGTETVGEPCLWNQDCNGGDPYHATTDQGICVKGDGTASAPNDGVCVQNHTAHSCQSLSLWSADSCRSTTTISSLCDNVGSACDTTGECIDIQAWFVPTHAKVIGGEFNVTFDEVDDNFSINSSTMFGYCDDNGNANPEEQGMPCYSDDHCTGTCTKDYTAPVNFNEVIAADYSIDIVSDHTDKDADAPVLWGASSNGTRDFNRVTGAAFSLTVNEGTNSLYVNESEMFDFKAPAITGTPTFGQTPAVLRIRDQWGSSSYRPYLIRIDGQTEVGAATFTPGIWINEGGWDNGYVLWGSAYMWNESNGTGAASSDDRLRIQFDARPSSHNDGEVLYRSSGDATTGVMHWGDGSTITTGNAVCSHGAYDLTCLDAGNMGSDGSATDCSSTLGGGGVRIWAMCY